MYNDTDNFLVYGGIKFREGLSKHASNNLIAYGNGPDSRQVPFADQVKGTNNTFLRNTVLTGTGQFYGACAGYVHTQCTVPCCGLLCQAVIPSGDAKKREG